jgi:hypothetical protein
MMRKIEAVALEPEPAKLRGDVPVTGRIPYSREGGSA